MIYRCTNCKKKVAEHDNQEMPQLLAVNGAELQLRPDEAPRCRCKCGRIMILLPGSAS